MPCGLIFSAAAGVVAQVIPPRRSKIGLKSAVAPFGGGTMTKQIVGYIRVSTAQQGKSGLGLAAQREALAKFAAAEEQTRPLGKVAAEKGAISDAPRDLHRGCRAAGSPGCCPLPGSARAFPGRRPRAGIARRRSAPACRRGARAPDRWSFPPVRHGLDPAAAASANNWRHAPAVAARSGPAGLWAQAGPAHSLFRAPQSAGMKERVTGLSPGREFRSKARRASRFVAACRVSYSVVH